MDLQLERVTEKEAKCKPDQSCLGFGRHFSDHMLVMSYTEGKGWHDASIQPYRNFSLDPAAMVLHYGQAIFEGMKAYRGKDGGIYLFRPADNLARMNLSAARLCMPQLEVDKVLAALKELLRLDQDWIPSAKGATLYIRPTMIATEAALGVRPAKQYLFFVILSPVGAYYPEGFNPVKIYVTDKYVRAVPGGVGHVKTAGNYAASIMAAVEAQRAGFTQVLWLDAVERKYIEEVGTMNIFFVIGDEVIAAMYRTSEHWITNTARGGEVSTFKLDAKFTALALGAAHAVNENRKAGALLGIDLIETSEGLKVVEVNSGVEFHGLLETTDIDIPKKMIEFCVMFVLR